MLALLEQARVTSTRVGLGEGDECRAQRQKNPAAGFSCASQPAQRLEARPAEGRAAFGVANTSFASRRPSSTVLTPMRGRRERYSDVILRLVELEK
jgi:hypothetical protein